MNKVSTISPLYIVGQCHMSSLALYHILTPYMPCISITSVNQLTMLDMSKPIQMVMTIDLRYADDMHEKLAFLFLVRSKKWNIRLALVMMSHPVIPVFIRLLLQDPLIHYALFYSYEERGELGRQFAYFFSLNMNTCSWLASKKMRLSPRERMVLTYLLQGESMSRISRILLISMKTVYCYRQGIITKWGLTGPRDLTLYRRILIKMICSNHV